MDHPARRSTRSIHFHSASFPGVSPNRNCIFPWYCALRRWPCHLLEPQTARQYPGTECQSTADSRYPCSFPGGRSWQWSAPCTNPKSACNTPWTSAHTQRSHTVFLPHRPRHCPFRRRASTNPLLCRLAFLIPPGSPLSKESSPSSNICPEYWAHR